MAYKRQYIGKMHPEYQGSGMTEVIILDDDTNETVAHFTGKNAREDATAFMRANHAPDNVIALRGKFV